MPITPPAPPPGAVTPTPISQIAGSVLSRVQDPTAIFWNLNLEIYQSLLESINDLMLIIGRPTLTYNSQITLNPNSVWQPMPSGLLAITNIRSNNYTLWKTTLHEMDYDQASWGCYDDQTEVLTDHGWRKFYELEGIERVASLSPEGYLEYQFPTRYHRYPFKGNLITFAGQGIDLRVTPNHNMYVRTAGSRWQLIPADEPIPESSEMKKDALWKGVEQKTINIGGYLVDMDTWLEFLGYFLSEGSTSSSTIVRKRQRMRYKVKSGEEKECVLDERPQTSYIVQISQKKQHNLAKIDDCISAMPFAFWKNIRKGHVTWTLNRKGLYRELADFGKSHQKYIPEYVKGLSIRQLRILFDALMLGDGTWSEDKATYYTSSAKLADDVQELVLKIGYAADIGLTDRREEINNQGSARRQLEYRVGISRVETTPRNSEGWKNTEIFYEGAVYCVSVPNRVIMVRRNGKSVWCGNSDWELDTADSPLRWGPIGLSYFFVHPAPTQQVQVNIAGVAYPNPTPWPPTGAETSPFHTEIEQALALYAESYLRLKQIADDATEGDLLYQQYLAIAKRLTALDDRRDPILFSQSYGVASAPSRVTLR